MISWNPAHGEKRPGNLFGMITQIPEVFIDSSSGGGLQWGNSCS